MSTNPNPNLLFIKHYRHGSLNNSSNISRQIRNLQNPRPFLRQKLKCLGILIELHFNHDNKTRRLHLQLSLGHN